MRLYSVFADPSADSAMALERAVFIRHGFSWPAFFLFPLWSLYHRLWGPLLLWLAVSAAASGLAAAISAPWHWGFLASLAIAVIFAFEAAGLRRAKLHRRYAEIGQVWGDSLTDCETRFFTRYLAEPDPAPPAASEAPGAAA